MNKTRHVPINSALTDPQIPVQAKIAAAWTSVMFLYIYVDYFHLYKPGAIDDIMVGVVYKFDISPTLLTIFLALIAIPALMVLLSMTLPARVNRATNLVVASLYIPVSVFNAAGESWDWASFYGLHRNRGADPGLHPALRLDLAPNALRRCRCRDGRPTAAASPRLTHRFIDPTPDGERRGEPT